MEFRTYASNEANSLITTLLGTQARAALDEIEALRQALDRAAKTLAAPAAVEGPVQVLASRLTEAADAAIGGVRSEADAAIARLRSELQSAHDRAEAAEHDLMITVDAHAEIETHLRKIESDWKQTQEAKASVEAELSQAHTTIQQLLADVEQLRARIDQQSAEHSKLTAALNQASETARQRDTLITQLEGRAAQVQVLETELAQARKLGEQLEAAFEAGKTRIQTLLNELGKAREVREQRDALAAQINASATRIRALETDLITANEVREQRDTLAAQLDASNTRISALESDLLKANEARGQRDALVARLDASGTRIRILETDLAKAKQIREHRDALAAQLEEASTRIRSLENELATAHENHDVRDSDATVRAQQLEKELAAARTVRDERDRFAIKLEEANVRLHALEKDLGAARQVRDERDRFAIQLEKTSARISALENELAGTRHLLAKSSDQAVAIAPASPAVGDVEPLRAELDRMASLFDASARAVAEMTGCDSSTELLAELVKRLSLHFSRVALFRLKGNRLEGEHQVGLDAGGDISKLVIPMSVDSVLTRAISSGAVQSLHGDDTAVRSGTPFGGMPTSAVALPIVLQGTTLAVVYADDAEMPESKRGPATHETSVGFARLLVGQVVVLLLRHTHELKTLAELSQYATTLLQEAKEMYLADTQAGKKAELVRKRLKDNIDCACQLYAYRAAMEGSAAAALLDQQIVAEMQETTPFANDLASVVAEMAAGDLQITAEAS